MACVTLSVTYMTILHLSPSNSQCPLPPAEPPWPSAEIHTGGTTSGKRLSCRSSWATQMRHQLNSSTFTSISGTMPHTAQNSPTLTRMEQDLGMDIDSVGSIGLSQGMCGSSEVRERGRNTDVEGNLCCRGTSRWDGTGGKSVGETISGACPASSSLFTHFHFG